MTPTLTQRSDLRIPGMDAAAHFRHPLIINHPSFRTACSGTLQIFAAVCKVTCIFGCVYSKKFPHTDARNGFFTARFGANGTRYLLTSFQEYTSNRCDLNCPLREDGAAYMHDGHELTCSVDTVPLVLLLFLFMY